MIPQSQIGPNLVGNDHAIVGLVHFHGLLDFPTFPHAPARIVRAAEHGHVDVMLLELPVHILVIHAPYAALVQRERTVDDAVAVVFDAPGEPDVGWAVQQHAVAGGGERGQRTDHTAQDPVLVADRLPGQSGDPVARGLPVDDGAVIVVGGGEVPVGGMLRPFDDGLRDRGHGREVHVRHPHGDDVETLAWRVRRESRVGAQSVDRDRIHAMPVHDGREIIRHCPTILSRSVVAGPNLNRAPDGAVAVGGDLTAWRVTICTVVRQ